MARKPMKDGRNVLVSMNPATMETLAEIPMQSADEVRARISAAEGAFPAWSALPIEQRAAHILRARDWLLAHLDEVCEVISKENGKPRVEALNNEVFLVADLMTYYSKHAAKVLADRPISLHNPIMKATKSSRLVYEPLGVVSVVTPWNYPFSIPMSGIVFALLAGNTVVFKPASDAALIGLKIDEILQKGGGLPAGVLNTVIAAGKDVGSTLFEPPVRRVVFTGSTEVGMKIQEIATKHFISTSMELGGKDPMVVCDDADLDLAGAGAVWGGLSNCGQMCSSVERVYVARPVYDAFVAKVVERVKALRVGADDGDYDVEVGPMANDEQLKTVVEHVRDALAKGARVLAGGKRPDRPGFFFEPTVLVDVNHTMKVMKEETFGPILPIMPVESDDEAVMLANDSPYGLTASVWTRDKARGEALAHRIQSGTVTVNDHAYTYAVCETPWQGMKSSGIGRSHSDAGLLEFVYPKHVNVDHSPSFAKRRVWWFPYGRPAYEVQKLAVRAFASVRELPRLLAAVATRKDYRKALM